MATGFVALGWVMSVGIISISMNAVGWIAIGMNAVGFVSFGLVNSIGVFSFGGVNGCGGWGVGGVNADGGRELGLFVSAVIAVALLFARTRTWPANDDEALVPLDVATAGGALPARARLVEVRDGVVLRAGAMVVRARVPAELLADFEVLGRGARVLVRFARVPHAIAGAGYRDEAAELVTEVVSVERDPRPSFVWALVSDNMGINLVFAWAGLVAAFIAYFRWR
jgi:hypothetical protein